MTPVTLVHELISLVGIASGVVVALGLLGGWTVLFLTATIATSVTGFGFSFDHLLPAHVIGLVSIAVLAVALIARWLIWVGCMSTSPAGARRSLTTSKRAPRFGLA
jgi:hypothetical protein